MRLRSKNTTMKEEKVIAMHQIPVKCPHFYIAQIFQPKGSHPAHGMAPFIDYGKQDLSGRFMLVKFGLIHV